MVRKMKINLKNEIYGKEDKKFHIRKFFAPFMVRIMEYDIKLFTA